MRKLVPVKRLDKNGRAVTRHVLSDSESSNKNSGIPAPSLDKRNAPLSLSVETRIRRNILKLAEVSQNSYGEGLGITTLKYLAKRSPADFRQLEKDLMKGNDWFRRNWGDTLNAISFKPKNDSADMLPNLLQTREIVKTVAFLTEGEDVFPDGTRLRGAALRGIAGRVPIEDYDMTRAALVAAWILPRTPNGSYSSISYDAHKDSLEYIKANYERVIDRRHVLKERGSIDPEVLEMVLDSNASSIVSGVL